MTQPTQLDIAKCLLALGVDASKANSKGWSTVQCPSCGKDGSAPSLRVNLSGAFKCWRCNSSSSVMSLSEFVENPRSPLLASSVGQANDKPELDEDLIDRYHSYLLDSPGVMKDLERVRGWSESTIRRIKIGWDGSHFWLPIYSITGDLVNARMYDPFRRSKIKSYHYSNETGTRRTAAWVPFGPQSLEGHSSVWLFEGEPDGILAAQMGFPSCVITGGAGTWTDEILAVVKQRRVVICYDMDSKGVRGARSVAARLKANDIEVVVLKFELSDPSKLNDFSDAVHKDGKDAAYFKKLAASSDGGSAEPPEDPPLHVTLGGGVPGMSVVVRAHVLGTHTTPLLVPASIQATCRMNWQPDRACRGCPMNAAEGSVRHQIEAGSEDVAQLAVTPVKSQDIEFKRILGVPLRCPVIEFENTEFWQLLLMKLVPPMSERGGGDTTIRSSIYVSPADGRPPEVKANQLYSFTGRIGPDVRNNEWTLMATDARPSEDDADSFVVTDALVDLMRKAFNPAEWTMEEVERVIVREERSMSAHVTRIYGRDLILRVVDLAYHSAISFRFKDTVPQRGWLSVGIIGDSRTGKSETLQRVSSYFGIGRMVMDPANTTFAGLVGGLQQVGSGDKAWMITWGLIPSNDRGIVLIDELSSLSTSDIGKMSGMRSSGIAELVKIRSSSTPARTRLVMSGNPRGEGRGLASYSTSVEAFQELIGAREDVARFDCAIAVKQGLDKEDAKSRLGHQPPPVPVALRRALIKYAWSRNTDHIRWEEGAESLCVALSRQLIDDYDPTIPLVEPSEQDLRLARVSVAVAIRTFSTTEDPEVVLVRKCHVRFADRTIRQCFDGDLGYGSYSMFRRRLNIDKAAVTKRLMSVQRDVAATARALLKLRRVNANSIGMVIGLDAADARELIATLVQLGAAEFPQDERASHAVWTSDMIQLLRDIERDPPKRNDEVQF